MGKKSN